MYLWKIASTGRDGGGGQAIRGGGASVSPLPGAHSALEMETLSLTHLLHRHGYSPPPKDTKVEDRNTGTRIVRPARNWASRGGRRRATPGAELP